MGQRRSWWLMSTSERARMRAPGRGAEVAKPRLPRRPIIAYVQPFSLLASHQTIALEILSTDRCNTPAAMFYHTKHYTHRSTDPTIRITYPHPRPCCPPQPPPPPHCPAAPGPTCSSQTGSQRPSSSARSRARAPCPSRCAARD